MPSKKQTIYLETSVISAYFDFWKVAQLQKKITREFWKTVLPKYRCVISQVVLAEIDNSITERSKKLKELVSGFTILEVSKKCLSLATLYTENGIIPKKNDADAIHLSVACMNKCDYLVTWNSKHLVRPYKLHQIYTFNKKHKVHFPILVKPEYFLNN